MCHVGVASPLVTNSPHSFFSPVIDAAAYYAYVVWSRIPFAAGLYSVALPWSLRTARPSSRFLL